MDASDAWRHLSLGNEGILMKLLFHFISVLLKNNKAWLAWQQLYREIHHRLRPGQLSYDPDLPSLYEASMSVDALVASSTEFPSRSSTPSVPPGFSALPHAHPLPLTSDEDTASKLQSRIDPTSATFTPSHVSSHAPRAATPLSNVFVPSTPTHVPASTQGYAKPKQDANTSVAATILAKNMALEPSVKPSPSALQAEDFPALESNKTRQAAPVKVASPAKSAILMAANKRQPAPIAAVPSPVAKPGDKRLPPGLTNISVPGRSTSGTPEGVMNLAISPSAFPPLSASSPLAAPLQSPIARSSSSKTSRLASTSRTEVPISVATPSSTISTQPFSLPSSRQPSLVSMSRHDRPGTPTSEMTDNASTTSAPLSRTNSPPPNRVGSAPLRTTTKSMQKKQRAQKAKERELSTVVPAEPEPEPEIAPIQGRKKKQKKEKSSTGGAGVSTPTVSRPPSPRMISGPAKQDIVPSTPSAQPPSQISDKHTLAENVPENKTLDMKGKGKAKAQHPATPEPVPLAVDVEDEPPEKPLPTPALVLQDLVSSGIISDVSNLNFLKAPHVNGRSQELQADLQNAIPKLTITPEDRASLLSGRLVHKNVDGPNRIMLTPNGDCVRNLTPEEEARYLELQSRIARETGPTAFFSAKHHASNGFTLIGGRAVPNGPPTFFPQLSSTTMPLDPVSKIQRDEALSYINQYVLPSLSTNSQLEKALNANALDTEVIRPSDSSAWAPWSNDSTPPCPDNTDGSYGASSAHGQEGILATGLEGITAHFAVGRDIDRGQPLGNVTLLSLRDAETAMQAARKETDGLEKRLNALLKKNRRLLLGSGN